MPVRRRRDGDTAGCLTILVVALASCGMYVFNSNFVTGVLAAAGPHLPMVLQQPKVVQVATLVGPTALVFIEWWLLFTFGAALHHALFGESSVQ